MKITIIATTIASLFIIFILSAAIIVSLPNCIQYKGIENINQNDIFDVTAIINDNRIKHPLLMTNCYSVYLLSNGTDAQIEYNFFSFNNTLPLIKKVK